MATVANCRAVLRYICGYIRLAYTHSPTTFKSDVYLPLESRLHEDTGGYTRDRRVKQRACNHLNFYQDTTVANLIAPVLRRSLINRSSSNSFCFSAVDGERFIRLPASAADLSNVRFAFDHLGY